MLKLKFSEHKLECGLDEAGRGCLAGPVTAAAVILKPNFNNKLINDSKKLSKNDREKLFEIIIKNSISYSIQNIYPKKFEFLGNDIWISLDKNKGGGILVYNILNGETSP